MSARHRMSRLFYFTIDDESILAEAFAKFEQELYAVAYKVGGTEDVFVTTQETKELMDRHDIPYALLGEEESSRVAVLHSPQSREDLVEYEDVLKALTLAYRAIAMACVGRNGDRELGFEHGEGAKRYTYFTAPAGHTYIWRLFSDREEAQDFLARMEAWQEDAHDWAESIPLNANDELRSFF